MGGACSAYGGEERRGVYRVCWGNLRERDHLEEPGVDGRMINIKMELQEVGCGRMDWIELAEDRALVNAVMNLRVP